MSGSNDSLWQEAFVLAAEGCLLEWYVRAKPCTGFRQRLGSEVGPWRDACYRLMSVQGEDPAAAERCCGPASHCRVSVSDLTRWAMACVTGRSAVSAGFGHLSDGAVYLALRDLVTDGQYRLLVEVADRVLALCLRLACGAPGDDTHGPDEMTESLREICTEGSDAERFVESITELQDTKERAAQGLLAIEELGAYAEAALRTAAVLSALVSTTCPGYHPDGSRDYNRCPICDSPMVNYEGHKVCEGCGWPEGAYDEVEWRKGCRICRGCRRRLDPDDKGPLCGKCQVI